MTAEKIAARAPEARAFFLAILPEVESRARAMLSRDNGTDRDEGVQEVTAQAWANFMSLHQRGRPSGATAYSLARFGVQHYRAGRRFAGTGSQDVAAPMTRAKGRSYIVSLHGASDEGRLGRELPDRRVWDNPYEATRQRLDWREIRLRCTERQAKVLGMLAQGHGTGEIAERLGVSPGRVSQIKSEIAAVVEEVGYAPAGCQG